MIDVGEGLSFTAPIISNVNFAGTLTEPGFTFDGGDIEEFGLRNIRSRDFSGDNPAQPTPVDGAVLTDASGTIGFGNAAGTIASNVWLENNFNTASSFFPRRTGAFTLEPTVGSFSVKGLGYQYEVVYDISPAAAEENADFDGSGHVDGADLLIWQRNVELTTGATPAQGNANPGVDGAVDGTDLGIWEAQFGTSPALAASTTVPEPSAGILALGLGILAAGFRRRAL